MLERIFVLIITILFVSLSVLIYKKKRDKFKIFLYIFIVIYFALVLEISNGTIFSKPIINIIGDRNITIEVNSEYVDLGAKAFHHNIDITNKIKTENNVDVKKVGKYNVKYSVKVFFTEIINTRTINVVDTTPPVLELRGNRDVKIYEGTDFSEDGYSATDNYDGDITQNVIVEKEQITEKQFKMNYKISDSSGNEVILYRVVDILPKEKADDASKNGVVFLTFDDGPSLDITPHILDILKEEDVKATFFVINFEGQEKEDLVKRAVSEGHSIGIHGYSHDYKSIYSSDDVFMNNVTSLREKILNVTGVDTKIMRFPGGSSNTVSRKYSDKIMSRLTQRVTSEGYLYFDWNVSSGDSGDVHTAKAVYNMVTKGLSKNKPNIVLMHDFSGNNKTLDALRNIIHFAKENGYTFEPINETTPLVMHKVNN